MTIKVNQTVVYYGSTSYGPGAPAVKRTELTGRLIVDVMTEADMTHGRHDLENGHFENVWYNCFDGKWYQG